MTRSTLDRLKDIVEYINDINSQLKDMDYEEFLSIKQNNRILYNALCYEFQVIGEAIKDLPKEFKNANEDIYWSGFVGMRNVLAHQYPNIELVPMWLSYSRGELNDLLSVVKKEINRIENESTTKF